MKKQKLIIATCLMGTLMAFSGCGSKEKDGKTEVSSEVDTTKDTAQETSDSNDGSEGIEDEISGDTTGEVTDEVTYPAANVDFTIEPGVVYENNGITFEAKGIVDYTNGYSDDEDAVCLELLISNSNDFGVQFDFFREVLNDVQYRVNTFASVEAKATTTVYISIEPKYLADYSDFDVKRISQIALSVQAYETENYNSSVIISSELAPEIVIPTSLADENITINFNSENEVFNSDGIRIATVGSLYLADRNKGYIMNSYENTTDGVILVSSTGAVVDGEERGDVALINSYVYPHTKGFSVSQILDTDLPAVNEIEMGIRLETNDAMIGTYKFIYYNKEMFQ